MKWLKKAASAAVVFSLLTAGFGPEAASAVGRNVPGPQDVPASLSTPAISGNAASQALPEAAPGMSPSQPDAAPAPAAPTQGLPSALAGQRLDVSAASGPLAASAEQAPDSSARDIDGKGLGTKMDVARPESGDSSRAPALVAGLEKIAPPRADAASIHEGFARVADNSSSTPIADDGVSGADSVSGAISPAPTVSAATRALTRPPGPQNKDESEENVPPLPRRYYLYLAALMNSSLAQAIITVLIPRLVYSHTGSVHDLIVAQFPGLIAIVLGSGFGAWGVSKLGSKNLYITANAADGLFFGLLCMGLVVVGVSIPTPFYALFAFVSSFFYGALRGVAERDINVRILGQKSQALLKKGFQSYYFVVSPVYIGTAVATGLLFDTLGVLFFCAAGGVAAFLSAVLFYFLSTQESGGVEEESGQVASLPLRQYWPHIFFFGNHQEVFFLFFPFFALFLFQATGLSSWFVGAYALGNWLLFLANWLADKGYLRKSIVRLGWRRWTLLGIATTIAFLGAPFLMQWVYPKAEMEPLAVVAGIPLDLRTVLSLVLGVLLGTGNAAAQGEWTSYYQKCLFKDKQPRVFFRLTAASMAFCLVPFALFKIVLSLSPEASMASLVGWASAGVILAGIAIGLTLPKNLESK